MGHVEFSFRRSRGIVWVCDIRGSSKLLNDNSTAGILEEFLPRFHWLGLTVVEAIGGTFVKWTGDGFLAWFETPLHRDVEKVLGSILEAVSQLTFTVNVTQLNIKSESKVRIRHGLTFEHDALLTTMSYADGHKSIDVTGRAVVLAFRLSGVPTLYPFVAVDRAIAQASRDSGLKHWNLKPWKPLENDLLRHFKGERWGTKGVMFVCEKENRLKSMKTIVVRSRRLIAKIENQIPGSVDPNSFSSKYVVALSNGPDWARSALRKEMKFLKEGLLDNLKKVTDIMAKHVDSESKKAVKNKSRLRGG